MVEYLRQLEWTPRAGAGLEGARPRPRRRQRRPPSSSCTPTYSGRPPYDHCLLPLDPPGVSPRIQRRLPTSDASTVSRLCRHGAVRDYGRNVVSYARCQIPARWLAGDARKLQAIHGHLRLLAAIDSHSRSFEAIGGH
ncbi:hypothetical protein ACJJTC_005511 [Scirpophaga incertulas]